MWRVLVILGFLCVGTAFAEEPKTVTPSKEDVLRWENLTLKIQLHESRVEAIKRDVQDAAQRLAVERDTFGKAFEKSYGVPVDRVERKGDQWIVKPEPPKAPKETK